MKLMRMAEAVTDWSRLPATAAPVASGAAQVRARQLGDIQLRLVDYGTGYLADHWCSKGHVLLCVAGELETELADGRRFTLRPGMSYLVGDGAEPHRSSTAAGATLFIVD